jgi:hypothetical protein
MTVKSLPSEVIDFATFDQLLEMDEDVRSSGENLV